MCECECLDPSGPHLCSKSHLNGAQTFQNLRLISTDLEAAPPTAVSPTLRTCCCLRPFAHALFTPGKGPE